VLLVGRFVLGVDMERFGSRTAQIQLLLQRELDRMLHDAADCAGIPRTQWSRQPAGDGEVAVLPPDVDLLAAVRRFVTELDQRLIDHNEAHSPAARIRLRVAMHVDALTPGTLGYAGPAFVVLQRLLDCTPVRTALSETPRVTLAQIVSESLYRMAVLPELGGLRPAQFRQVRVDVPAKGFDEPAYLYLPGAPPIVRPPTAPTGFLPIPSPDGMRRQRTQEGQRPPEGPIPVAEEPIDSTPVLDPAVHDLVHQLRKSLEAGAVADADALTTLVLLEAASRTRNGWLRDVDGPTLPDSLLTDVDEMWAEHSGGGWGFRAQRERGSNLTLAMPPDFRRLSVALGWREDEDEIVKRYAEFAGRADRGDPFYPTLRTPERERYPEWQDEWSSTVRCVHVRLRQWEH
jgi:hypothetical protein